MNGKLSTLLRLGAGACVLYLAGCGSSGPATNESDAIARMKDTLATYNSATTGSVASTGTACTTALSDLQGAQLLGGTVAPGKDLAVRRALHSAYLEARAGFSDCATGARTMNFPLMARANDEIQTANAELAGAKAG